MIKKAITLVLLYTIFQSCESIPISNAHKNGNFAHSLPAVIDMGVDYNDELPLDYMKNALVNITLTDNAVTNEYNDFLGSPRLRKAIASFYSKSINRELNPENEVLATNGGTEALFTTIRALTSIGDEWIIIEPFYTAFRRQVEFANAVPRFTSLKPPKAKGETNAADWYLDREELESLINPKTRGIICNNPNNPLGKNHGRDDLEFITHLANKHNLIIISDEVHEFSVDSIIRMATIPGVYERTVTIGSASKAFGVPGWRVGWVYGPAELIERIRKIHADVVGFPSMPAQEAVSVIFEREVKDFGSPLSFVAKNVDNVKRQRNFIVQAFRDAGMQPIVPEGGYCMLAGWSKLRDNKNILQGSNFADWLIKNIKIQAFSASNYYSEHINHLGDNKLRFCYHKSKSTLQNAAKYLLKLKDL